MRASGNARTIARHALPPGAQHQPLIAIATSPGVIPDPPLKNANQGATVGARAEIDDAPLVDATPEVHDEVPWATPAQTGGALSACAQPDRGGSGREVTSVERSGELFKVTSLDGRTDTVDKVSLVRLPQGMAKLGALLARDAVSAGRQHCAPPTPPPAPTEVAHVHAKGCAAAASGTDSGHDQTGGGHRVDPLAGDGGCGSPSDTSGSDSSSDAPSTCNHGECTSSDVAAAAEVRGRACLVVAGCPRRFLRHPGDRARRNALIPQT